MNETTNILTPIFQYGFAGFCGILLGILVWLIRELLKVLKENNSVIAANTAAIASVDKNARSAFDLTVIIKDELLKRPCIKEIKR